ncbi:hypothetical protein BPMI_05022 [Candidatus Burkholderia pumila]|uniref:Mobile element protein n=1 Tax=Candidatus Burkholderia pumila TaxID=1090375 RepID=A0ABR5HKS7_9BURK|nr:hypothetical protein BPMI_05022 [Candidatus Burkholderia pumila]
MLECFVRATSLFAVIAWRILYTTLLARLDGDLPCEVILQRVEWQVLAEYIEPPGHRTRCRRCTRRYNGLWIATLGGTWNCLHDPPPGATVIWRGFLVLHEIT